VQQTEARRRAGSHYTPADLCTLVVQHALDPLVQKVDTSDELLKLKICDPSMGSGAFLMAAGEYLAERLSALWEKEGQVAGVLPTSSDEARPRARREVFARCLYGVDIDPVAVRLCRQAVAFAGSLSVTDKEAWQDHFIGGDALVGFDFRARETFSLDEEPAPEAERAALDAHLRAAGEQGVRMFDAFIDRALVEMSARDQARALAKARSEWAALAPLEFEERLAHAPYSPRSPRPCHFAVAFPEVQAQGGFDAIVGNPPWIAYVGRAAQPLARELFEYYRLSNPAFASYRTLHGLFVHRAARLLRVGGRLGFVLPTSIADLSGYAPTRAAHDTLCRVDVELPDFGDGRFEGVFQPCMGLLATRDTDVARPLGRGNEWPLARDDLSGEARSLLERLATHPVLPPSLFAERGFQTTGRDLPFLRRQSQPSPEFSMQLREGTDVQPFVLTAPTLCIDPSGVAGRLRRAERWQEVGVLIRQTARFPIAAPSDGLAFRNSILAGLPKAPYSALLLVHYLNSELMRWYHYTKHRDARQGMPQLKIGHLRALPAPPPKLTARLNDWSETQSNPPSEADTKQVNAWVFEAFNLSKAECAMVREWARANPVPLPRRKAEARSSQRLERSDQSS
jgi:hypothetical protein